jgi:uncharacterized protein YjbI with pentapeptide repeats
MTQETDVSWPTCDEPGCIGVQLDAARVCLAHATEEDRTAALKLVGETGVIDARGVPITSALLQRVLTVAPRGMNGQPLIKDCRFDNATFSGEARFEWTTFSDAASFGEATFTGPVFFTGAAFTGAALFRVVTFTGPAFFDGAAFSGDAWFGGATFGGDAWFGGAAFKRLAEFHQATFCGAARFVRATFVGDARFDLATLGGSASFGGAIFRRRADFERATFEQARQFGPLLAYRGLVLDDVQFARPVRIEASTIGLCCRRALFPEGVQFRLRWAHVVLDDTNLPSPSILAGVPPMGNPELQEREKHIARAWQRLLAAGEVSERPQLLSLQRANVAGLGLSNVSAADCRFAGAHNLDKLRLEPAVSFATAPVRLGGRGRRWDGREVIAEERAWRAKRSRPRHWVAPWWPRWLNANEKPGVLDPGQIAGLYRELRKGREDAKDEPGAADFYYGEMEMRSRARPLSTGNPDGASSATSRGRVERGILTAYWLVSGYGLRAWRALACLAVVTALLAVAFHFVGFAVPPHPVSYWTSLLYAFRATLSLTDNDVTLTAWGKLLQGVLRLTGPVLLGLALLALRGRVKR